MCGVVVTELLKMLFRVGVSSSIVAIASRSQNMQVEGIFCVLTKAFVFMNHEILLAELHFCGIQGVSEY